MRRGESEALVAPCRVTSEEIRPWRNGSDGGFRIVPWIDLDHLGGGPASKHEAVPYVAMEPAECLEPLNLVMKKDDIDDGGPTRTTVIGVKIGEASIDEEEKDAVAAEDNMAILQDAVKSAESGGLPTADHKLLTALYMSSLVQMSNLSAPRGIAPPPYGASQQQQQSFMQLLAMVEARHRMWQQMNWPLPQSFLRSPLTLPPTAPSSYFDGATTTSTPTPTPPSLTEQLSQNSAPTYPLSCAKSEPLNSEVKQSYFNKRYTIGDRWLCGISVSRVQVTRLKSCFLTRVLQVNDRAEKLHVVTCGQCESSGHRTTK